MRLALVSLIALTATAATAVAQPASPPPPAAPAAGAPAASPAPAAAGAPASTAASATPDASAPPAGPTTLPPLPDEPQAPVMPATPPPPPTDPTAIAVLSVLTNVCIPAANGGDTGQLAKANGFRKTSDTWTLRQSAYTLVVENPGTNPNQCHVDVTHAAIPDAPGREIVVALHNWAELTNGWSLYRNDKSVQAGAEYTTRSWQKDTNGKSEGLAFITTRKADGTPTQRTNDTSQLIYSQTKDPAS
jgi:hypothetical protein